MILGMLNLLMTVIASILAGVFIRITSGRNPDSDDLKKFINDVFSHEIPHRGGAFNAPENTMCAFQKAVEYGSRAIEIDIQYTADGIPVVIHDETLDRTTNGSGPIAKKTLKEIKELSANYTFSQSEVGECKVPTLDETIEFAIENDLILLLDVKGGEFCAKFSETLTDIQKRYPAFSKKFAVISFFPDILYNVRQKHPTVFTGFTRRHDHIQDICRNQGYLNPTIQSLLFLADRVYDFVMFYVFVPWMKINMLEIRKDDVSESYVKSVAPLPVLTWTVNDPEEKAFFKKIGCAVMSDVLVLSDGK